MSRDLKNYIEKIEKILSDGFTLNNLRKINALDLPEKNTKKADKTEKEKEKVSEEAKKELEEKRIELQEKIIELEETEKKRQLNQEKKRKEKEERKEEEMKEEEMKEEEKIKKLNEENLKIKQDEEKEKEEKRLVDAKIEEKKQEEINKRLQEEKEEKKQEVKKLQEEKILAEERLAEEKAAKTREINYAEFNTSDVTGRISNEWKQKLKNLYLTMVILMKQPAPFIIFNNVYNKTEERKNLFISTDGLAKKLGPAIAPGVFENRIKNFIVNEDGEEKILIHLLLKILYKNYIPYDYEFLNVDEKTYKKLNEYYNFIIGKLNTYSTTDQSIGKVKQLINETNETNAKLGNIDLSIKIRQGMKKEVEKKVNARVQIDAGGDNFQINWNATPEEISYEPEPDSSSYEDNFDKYKFRGKSHVFLHQDKPEKIAKAFYDMGVKEDNVEIYFLSGQSGSGKTFTTLGDEKNKDAGFVLKMLKNHYKPETIDIIVGEIFEEESDKFLNYKPSGNGINTKFRKITTETIVKRIDAKKSTKDIIATFQVDGNGDWQYEGISIADFLITSLKIRSVLPTTNNAQSSRSNVIIYIKFKYNREKDGREVEKKIFIIDAAGVENKFKCGTAYFEERFKAKAKTVANDGWLRGTLSSILTPKIKENYDYKLEKRKFKLQNGGDLPKNFQELELEMMKRNRKKKGELARKFTGMVCAPPGSELNKAEPFKYVEEEREKLKEHISTLVESIFTWDKEIVMSDFSEFFAEAQIGEHQLFPFNNQDDVGELLVENPETELPAELPPAESSNNAEDVKNMLNISFIGKGLPNQKLARQWLKKKLDKLKNNKYVTGLKLLNILLYPNEIKYKINFGSKSNVLVKSKNTVGRFISNYYVYGETPNEAILTKETDIVNALTLLITLINEDLKQDKKECVIKSFNEKTKKKEISPNSPIITAIKFNGINHVRTTYEDITKNKDKNFFKLDTKNFSSLWNVIEIKPDLPNEEQCTESLKNAFEELCKNMVKQGSMINSELEKFKNKVQVTGKTLPILPYMLSNGQFEENEVESSDFLNPQNTMKVDDLIETFFSPSSAKTDDELIDKQSWIMVGLLRLYNETPTNNATTNNATITMDKFLKMIKIHIILVINITREDFGNVFPNNPPTPSYVNLELLKNIIHDIKFRPDTNSLEKVSKANEKKTDDSREERSLIQEVKEEEKKGLLTPTEKENYFISFARILAFILTDINKYKEYQDLNELLEVLEHFNTSFEILKYEKNFHDEKWVEFIAKIDAMKIIIEKNNAATLIGNSYEMFKLVGIEPVTYEMSKNKKEIYKKFEGLSEEEVKNKIQDLRIIIQQNINKKKDEKKRLQDEKEQEENQAKLALKKKEEDFNKLKGKLTKEINIIINKFDVGRWSVEGTPENREQIITKLNTVLASFEVLNWADGMDQLKKYKINGQKLFELCGQGHFEDKEIMQHVTNEVGGGRKQKKRKTKRKRKKRKTKRKIKKHETKRKKRKTKKKQVLRI